ncbi:zinc-dependent metalloprotease [Dokdonella soli]|uniref:Zinc-dependent metalloprotease family protein n=1 Tax=Dokdonella soli TaxID=529810 RepID=A0ABN1IUQ9_9GAMM
MRRELAVARANGIAMSLALPRPEGGFAEFEVTDSHAMPKELADRYPEIVSLAGTDGEGRKVRIDSSPLGFQAMVFDHEGIWMVRPETPGTGDRYLSFRRADLAPAGGFQCGVRDARLDASGKSLLAAPQPMTLTGSIHRDYRVAVAANHNYVAAVGANTIAGGLAAVVQAMNRVNQVYETELAVHMTLVANNDRIIYPGATGDPYSNDGLALDQNQPNLDKVIGSANYDIGHVFTTGSGGQAALGVTCVDGQKAQGTTGMSNPMGDAFYIDYVAHEMGHQFGADHTFNSTAGACGGNRAPDQAYEPGSGTTVMAYAGICDADDVQPHSDPYFHAKSLDVINAWISGNGGTCATQSANPNAAPVIDTANLPNGFTIPARTPFALTGAANSTGGASISYNWEQYDLGDTTTLLQGDIGKGPIFRSFNAMAGGTRYFPRLSTILGGAPALGETLPTTTRDLNFRLTARDNRTVGGRSQSADVQLHVVSTSGPFTVTRPSTNITWGRGESHSVTWNVANTNVAPVNCPAVNIDLSADGGQTFGYPLAANVPNNGSAQIVVPQVANTALARVRVRCSSNVFLNISAVNFKIAAVGDPDPGALQDVIFKDGFDGP